MSYRLRLTNICKDDRLVEDYDREFLRLSQYAEDLMRDQYFTVSTYVTGLGSAFAEMPTAGLTLESVIELAKEIELRLIRQGVMPDLYQVRNVLTRGYQSAQHTVFQIGSSSCSQRNQTRQNQQSHSRVHRKSRHGHSGIYMPNRFGASTINSSSGQSSSYGSAGSAPTTCQTCGRVHQGQCYLTPLTCFRCGQTGHIARTCPYSGYQQQFPHQSIVSAAPVPYQVPPAQYPNISHL